MPQGVPACRERAASGRVRTWTCIFTCILAVVLVCQLLISVVSVGLVLGDFLRGTVDVLTRPFEDVQANASGFVKLSCNVSASATDGRTTTLPSLCVASTCPSVPVMAYPRASSLRKGESSRGSLTVSWRPNQGDDIDRNIANAIRALGGVACPDGRVGKVQLGDNLRELSTKPNEQP